MAGGGEEKVFGLFQLFGGGHVPEVDYPLVAAGQRGAEDIQPAAARQPVGELGARLWLRERRRLAHGVIRGDTGQLVGRRVPLPDQAGPVQYRDPVSAAVDDGPLVRTLPQGLLEGHRVGQRDARVPGQQLQQLQLDMTEITPAVEGVERAVGAVPDMRQAEGDGVQARQRGPDQVVQAADVTGGHHDRLARPHQVADQAGGQVRGAAAQPGRQTRGADQPEHAVLDDHKATGVRACQLAQARRDAVEHRFQVTLSVHISHDVAQPAHDAGPLGHVVAGHVVFAGLMADVDPAGHLTAGAEEDAGVDPDVQHAAVLADPAGREGDLAPTADPFEHRVVLGLELFRDDRRLETDHLGRRPAEHPLRGRVPQQHGPVGAEGDDRIGRALDDRTGGGVDPVLAGYRIRWLCHHPLMVPLDRHCGSPKAQVNRTPGLRRPIGSSAVLMARMAPISCAERLSDRRGTLARPMPCSAEIEPPCAAASRSTTSSTA